MLVLAINWNKVFSVTEDVMIKAIGIMGKQIDQKMKSDQNVIKRASNEQLRNVVNKGVSKNNPEHIVDFAEEELRKRGD